MRVVSLNVLVLTVGFGCSPAEEEVSPARSPQPTVEFARDAEVSPPRSGRLPAARNPVRVPQARNPELPPLLGGGLAVTGDGATAVIAEPDRDSVLLVDVESEAIHEVLLPGREPGRVVLRDGLAYVVLRRGGLSVIDIAEAKEITRFETCAMPRGLAFQPDGARLWLACATGELRAIDPATGQVKTTVTLDPDLRDVAFAGEHLFVSRFRSAELLVLRDGELVDRWHMPGRAREGRRGERPHTPTVAWRMVADGAGGVYVLHQRARIDAIIVPPVDEPPEETEPPEHDPYGGINGVCETGLVTPAVTHFTDDGRVISNELVGGSLAVDLAARSSVEVAVAFANSSFAFPYGRYFVRDSINCLEPFHGGGMPDRVAVAVAYDDNGRLYSLLRHPTTLRVDIKSRTWSLPLPQGQRDAGRALFHEDFGAGITCASCHPEGTDDGHVWHFANLGLRRTQNLRGGLRGTEPFHWNGELADIEALVGQVMVRRMGAPHSIVDHAEKVLDWMDAQPAVVGSAPQPVSAIARGRALFTSEQVGCTGCHGVDGRPATGAHDVGTGGLFEVPPLMGIASRPPYLHDGCAQTLTERFEPDCGGGDKHGHTSHLDAGQIADLVAFLHTL